LEGGSCCSSFFVLGEGSVLLIVFCFGRWIRAAHRFLLCERDTCCSSIFWRGVRVAYRFLFWEGVSCCSSFFCF
jgi:hypothetical protein